MSIRVDIQRDLECESLRFVATATLDGKRLHEVDEYGGPEVRNEMFKEYGSVAERARILSARPLLAAGLP